MNLPDVEKSNREKDLEKKVKAETDRDRKPELRSASSPTSVTSASARTAASRSIGSAWRSRSGSRIAEQRLRGGSRFNIRYEDRVPVGVKPEDVVATLVEFVDFRGDAAFDAPRGPADITQLKGSGVQRGRASIRPPGPVD